MSVIWGGDIDLPPFTEGGDYDTRIGTLVFCTLRNLRHRMDGNSNSRRRGGIMSREKQIGSEIKEAITKIQRGTIGNSDPSDRAEASRKMDRLDSQLSREKQIDELVTKTAESIQYLLKLRIKDYQKEQIRSELLEMLIKYVSLR